MIKMNLTSSGDTIFKFCTLYNSKYEAVIRSPSKDFLISQFLVCSVNGVLIIFTVLLNSITIQTISKSSQLKNKLCYFLVFVQSVSDLLVGVIGLPLVTYVLVNDLNYDANCTVNVLFLQAPHLTSGYAIITISAINYERYLSILLPSTHRNKLTKNKLLSYVLLASVLHTLSVPTFFIHSNVSRLIIAIVVPLFLVTTAYVYFRIFAVAKKRLPIQHPPNEIAVESHKSTGNIKKNKLRELKLAKTCFMIVFVFVICFLPISIVHLLFPVRLGTVKLRIVQSWCVTFAMLNSSLNSVIFFWTRRVLRQEAKKVLERLFHNV